MKRLVLCLIVVGAAIGCSSDGSRTGPTATPSQIEIEPVVTNVTIRPGHDDLYGENPVEIRWYFVGRYFSALASADSQCAADATIFEPLPESCRSLPRN